MLRAMFCGPPLPPGSMLLRCGALWGLNKKRPFLFATILLRTSTLNWGERGVEGCVASRSETWSFFIKNPGRDFFVLNYIFIPLLLWGWESGERIHGSGIQYYWIRMERVPSPICSQTLGSKSMPSVVKTAVFFHQNTRIPQWDDGASKPWNAWRGRDGVIGSRTRKLLRLWYVTYPVYSQS